MGWRALFGRPRTRTFNTIESPSGHEVEVHGESFHQNALAAICGGRTREGVRFACVAIVVPENGNEHDKNAVRVEIQGSPVGYLTRPSARTYRSVLDYAADLGYVFTCKAVIVGGWDQGIFDKGSFGVWLDMATPAKLRVSLTNAEA